MATPTTNHTRPIAAATKRAFTYLRVSSDDQVETDYHRDGLSLLAQRQEADGKAANLDAGIVHEYKDPGKSAYVDLHKRTDFLAMLDEVERLGRDPATRIHYVIIWAVNRFARDTVDHWQARDVLRRAGTRLISITEPVVGEDTPSAFLYESTIVSQSQYSSMQTGEAVQRGIRIKASLGGTYGPARFGYLNTRDTLPDGRSVAAIGIDPERGHYATLLFQLYDSGQYSISELAVELECLGVRSRPSRRWPSKPMGTSMIQALLRNPYYAGWVVYKRGTPEEKVFPGRHDALIDQETFDRVQLRLDEKRIAGDRSQVHQHYLRGSVFCGDCGGRLVYGESRSRNGRRYPYYFCTARINGRACEMRTNIRPSLIEAAIVRYYRERPVQLSAADVRKRTEAIESLVAISQQAVHQVREAKTTLIAKLKAQQTRLIRLHLEEGDTASPDAFREERARMQAEIARAEQSLAETETRLQLDAQQLRLALELAEDVAQVYEQADQATKRGYNLAFFEKLYVLPDWDEAQPTFAERKRADVVSAQLTEPYAALLADELVPQLQAEVDAILAARNSEDGPLGPSSAGSSNFVAMAEGEGFEPSMDSRPCRFSRPVHSTALPPLRATAGRC